MHIKHILLQNIFLGQFLIETLRGQVSIPVLANRSDLHYNITKKGSLWRLKNEAANCNMLQPLAIFIAKEFKNIPIEEMRCYV